MDTLDEQVTALLAYFTDRPTARITRDTRLLEDLGMDGDEAVEFFQEFGRRFSPDLAPLYRHWSRHFGPEGTTSGDWRIDLGLLLLGVGAVIAAVVFDIELGWIVAPAALTLLGILTLIAPFVGRRPEIPIKVGDLIEAANTRRWPIVYGD